MNTLSGAMRRVKRRFIILLATMGFYKFMYMYLELVISAIGVFRGNVKQFKQWARGKE